MIVRSHDTDHTDHIDRTGHALMLEALFLLPMAGGIPHCQGNAAC